MSRRRQLEAVAPSTLPASKRLKTTKTTHVPAQSGFDFLVDEDARKGKKLEAKLTNGVPSSKTTRVDESHAIVAPDTKDLNTTLPVGSSPDNAIGIGSSDEESEDSEDDSDEESDEDELDGEDEEAVAEKLLPNGQLPKGRHLRDDSEDAIPGAEDVDMVEPDAENEADEEDLEEPSFGDMLQARHPDPIDVQASLPNPMEDRQALVPISGSRTITAPSGTSLGTVLTQALKTNDKDLLESCFHTTDLPSIRATIQRLQSQHVSTLLQRLAERIHKRPGRTGSLLVWVQWSLIAHGGYLAGQPELMKKLKSLSQVVRERANGLQPLLHLKGKLDMLSAQLELRRNIQLASRVANAEDEDDEEGVVYVEGQDEDWSDSDEMEEGVQFGSKIVDTPRAIMSKSKRQTATPNTDLSDSEDASDSDDSDMANGVIREGADQSSEEDEEDDEGLFDVEAEETSDDGDDELDKGSDEEADSDPESDEEDAPSDDDSDASGVRAPQPKTLNRKR